MDIIFEIEFIEFIIIIFVFFDIINDEEGIFDFFEVKIFFFLY